MEWEGKSLQANERAGRNGVRGSAGTLSFPLKVGGI